VNNEWFMVTWAPELGIFCAVSVNGSSNKVMTSSLRGRPPTSYNVFDSSFNSIDESGNWSLNFAQTAFTPTVISSGGGTPTYTTQVGRFTRISNLCFFQATIVLSGKGSLAAGNLSVSLPLTTSADIGASLNIGSLQENVNTTDFLSFFLNSNVSSSNSSIQYRGALTSTTLSNLTVALINNTFSISYGGSYFV